MCEIQYGFRSVSSVPTLYFMWKTFIISQNLSHVNYRTADVFWFRKWSDTLLSFYWCSFVCLTSFQDRSDWSVIFCILGFIFFFSDLKKIVREMVYFIDAIFWDLPGLMLNVCAFVWCFVFVCCISNQKQWRINRKHNWDHFNVEWTTNIG